MPNIIDYANAYDFEKIKICVENGDNINQTDQEGTSVITLFLESYYNSKDFLTDEEFSIMNDDDVDDYIREKFFDSHILNSSKIPLNERKGNILEKLAWFIHNGVDLNYRELVYGDYGYTPLTISVAFLDYYMTKFLLENNANPKQWITYDEEIEGKKYETFLLDDIDITILNGSYGEKELERMMDLAALLSKYIKEDYYGHTHFEVDNKAKIVKLCGKSLKY